MDEGGRQYQSQLASNLTIDLGPLSVQTVGDTEYAPLGEIIVAVCGHLKEFPALEVVDFRNATALTSFLNARDAFLRGGKNSLSSDKERDINQVIHHLVELIAKSDTFCARGDEAAKRYIEAHLEHLLVDIEVVRARIRRAVEVASSDGDTTQDAPNVIFQRRFDFPKVVEQVGAGLCNIKDVTVQKRETDGQYPGEGYIDIKGRAGGAEGVATVIVCLNPALQNSDTNMPPLRLAMKQKDEVIYESYNTVAKVIIRLREIFYRVPPPTVKPA